MCFCLVESFVRGKMIMKQIHSFYKYLISFLGAFVFMFIIISIFALASTDSMTHALWAIWFIGILALFYLFISSIFWELLFRFVPLKSPLIEIIMNFLYGAICASIALTIITSTIGEVFTIAWVISIFIFGIAAIIFYFIRKTTI